MGCAAGPHNKIGEDEFFDAVDGGLDKVREEQDYQNKPMETSNIVEPDLGVKASKATRHQLWPTIDKVYLVLLYQTVPSTVFTFFSYILH